jgi:hypothetical protein
MMNLKSLCEKPQIGSDLTEGFTTAQTALNLGNS